MFNVIQKRKLKHIQKDNQMLSFQKYQGTNTGIAIANKANIIS